MRIRHINTIDSPAGTGQTLIASLAATPLGSSSRLTTTVQAMRVCAIHLAAQGLVTAPVESS